MTTFPPQEHKSKASQTWSAKSAHFSAGSIAQWKKARAQAEHGVTPFAGPLFSQVEDGPRRTLSCLLMSIVPIGHRLEQVLLQSTPDIAARCRWSY